MCKKEKYFSHYFKERKKEFKCPASDDGSPACLKHECTITLDGIEYPIANCLIYEPGMICDLCEKKHHIISTFCSSEQGVKEAVIKEKYFNAQIKNAQIKGDDCDSLKEHNEKRIKDFQKLWGLKETHVDENEIKEYLNQRNNT